MLLSFSLSSFAEAQPQVVVGVHIGDWAKYGHVLIEWNSTDPNVKPDQELVESNNTDWFKNVVTNIDNQQIYFEQITQLKNDTQKTSNFQVNIDTGGGSGALHFIPAELFAGDVLYPDTTDFNPPTINETVLRASANVSRLVNHLNFVTLDVEDPAQTISISISHYWDRETGILTERRAAFVNQTGSYLTLWTRSDELVETSLWGGEETERPRANGGGDHTVIEGSSVVFDASGSSDNTGIVSYHWLFGDGATGDGLVVSHVYSRTGAYYAVLIVKDASGNMAFDAISVTVEPIPQNGTVEPPPQNGFQFMIIGAAAIVVVILAAGWVLRSRRKRRIKVRTRPTKHALNSTRQV